MIKKTLAALAVATLTLPAHALLMVEIDPGAEFAQTGSLTGSFNFDPVTEIYSDVSISTGAGPLISCLSDSDSSDNVCDGGFGFAEQVDGFDYDFGIELPPAPGTTEWNIVSTVDVDPASADGVDYALAIWFDTPLAAGTVVINFLEWNCPAGDCTFDIATSRLRISQPSVFTATVTEVPGPNPLTLVVAGLLTLLLGRRISD